MVYVRLYQYTTDCDDCNVHVRVILPTTGCKEQPTYCPWCRGALAWEVEEHLMGNES